VNIVNVLQQKAFPTKKGNHNKTEYYRAAD